ncbi:TPA: hypothetical protein H1016_01145 [archaeon]|uniref:Uncharacterized protein n=1 Tax=Candidatus Naiadarchaeum limnaeum TaxID=2756139 RepID=A0A832XLP0_9ARCH|nr:hypothetical protein [Candidatus Naiadarchaeum limnaeum]
MEKITKTTFYNEIEKNKKKSIVLTIIFFIGTFIFLVALATPFLIFSKYFAATLRF